MKIQAQIDIQAPIEKVFEVFSDLSQLENRIDGIDKVEVLEGPAQMQVGTKWKETRTMMGKEATEVMWVSELTPSKNYVVLAESNGTKYRSEYVFSEIDGGTNVVMTFGGTPVTFFAKMMSLLAILFSGSLKKMLIADMENLKAVCEA